MPNITVPLGGNSFATSGDVAVTKNGWSDWNRTNAVLSTYFKCRAGILTAALNIKAPKAQCVIFVRVSNVSASTGGAKTIKISAGQKTVPLGSYSVEDGYVDLSIRGISRQGDSFPDAYSLSLNGTAAEGLSGYVKDGDEANYYWTRRAPSVHCQYTLPSDDYEWFYNEVTAPVGLSPVGTYAMAIGFDGGYFGIQVNSKNERRILFSVWSPFNTDNPAEIPSDMRVRLRAHRPDVTINNFGGEGSGGQSYLKYMWKSGVKYRFAMRVRPVEGGYSEYSAYFYFPESNKWELIACFLRPKTQSYIKAPHSFLENFSDTNGYLQRQAVFTNQWAVTVGGVFVPVSRARVTFDATARAGNRFDCFAGTKNGGFYLTNGGFFDESASYGETLTVPEPQKQPDMPPLFYRINSED